MLSSAFFLVQKNPSAPAEVGDGAFLVTPPAPDCTSTLRAMDPSVSALPARALHKQLWPSQETPGKWTLPRPDFLQLTSKFLLKNQKSFISAAIEDQTQTLQISAQRVF